MNEILLDTSTSVSKRNQEFAPERSELFREKRQPALNGCAPVPVFFHCLGGNWEGQIQLGATGALELNLQGMPPVHVGQEMTFQCFGTRSTLLTSMQQGTIQHVTINRGPTVWEGSTLLRVMLHHSQKPPRTLDNSPIDSFALEPGSFVMSQVTKPKSGPSCDNELQNHESHPLQVSKTQTFCNPNNQASPANQPIKSNRVALENSKGHTIIAYHDYPIETDLSRLPVVVMAPGYGETKRDYLTLAYYFASNGFHVVRYDHTNHVGESDGQHFGFTLSSMKQDFQSVIRFVRQQWPQSQVIGVASSLAGPVTIKAEVEEPSLALLVLLVGVVDVERTVATVHQEDLFANYRQGHIPYSTNILGFNVNGHFLTDAATNNFSKLNHTIDNVRALQTPIFYISAGKDCWIDRQDAEMVKQAAGTRVSEWLDIPEALHRIQENPKVARRTYRHIIDHCRNHVACAASQTEIHEPNRLTLGRQNRHEKMALQAHSHTDVGQGFWDDYLGHFQSVGKCQDYVQLLDHVFRALGPITAGQYVLDVGCGNGNAGLFLLESLKHQHTFPSLTSEHSIRYVGIDASSEALGRAQAHMTHTYHGLQNTRSPEFPSFQMAWAQVDLQQPLPFHNHQFDRIVSNLVLGYVADPHSSLQELYRVLAPGGRMVLSNLKPNGDFSGIYQNLINQAKEHAQKAEARELLNNYGKIRQAEKEGQFRFFDQTEWEKALDSLGCVHAGVYPAFANQAYVIILEKPIAAGNFSLRPLQKTTGPKTPISNTSNDFKGAA